MQSTMVEHAWGSQEKMVAKCHLLFKIVPFVPDKSAWIFGMLFRTKMTNFASGSEPNRALFWGNNPEFILVMKKAFQQYIIFLCLKSFAKKSCFSRQFVKLTVKVCLVLYIGPTVAQIQDLRPLPDLFRCYEFIGSLKIGKQSFHWKLCFLR